MIANFEMKMTQNYFVNMLMKLILIIYYKRKIDLKNEKSKYKLNS